MMFNKSILIKGNIALSVYVCVWWPAKTTESTKLIFCKLSPRSLLMYPKLKILIFCLVFEILITKHNSLSSKNPFFNAQGCSGNKNASTCVYSSNTFTHLNERRKTFPSLFLLGTKVPGTLNFKDIFQKIVILGLKYCN